MRNTIAGLMTSGLCVVAAGAQEPPRHVVPTAPVPEQVRRLAWEHAERLCQFVDKASGNGVDWRLQQCLRVRRFRFGQLLVEGEHCIPTCCIIH